jgi:hypothetical protein
MRVRVKNTNQSAYGLKGIYSHITHACMYTSIEVVYLGLLVFEENDLKDYRTPRDP